MHFRENPCPPVEAGTDRTTPAQLDLIAHKTSDAIAKLEVSADLGSSAACSTLAKRVLPNSDLFSPPATKLTRRNRLSHSLLACGWRDEILMSPLPSPPNLGSSPGGGKNTRSHGGSRPPLPSRQGSNWTASQPSQNHANVLRAAALFIRGLEIELLLPSVPTNRETQHASDDTDDGDEQDLETACFNLERTLDLLIGVRLLCRRRE